MAISFVAAGAVAAQGSGTSLVLAVPAGVQDKDLLFAAIYRTVVGTMLLPSGWALIRETSLNSRLLSTYYKVASNAEPADYTWFNSSFTVSKGVIVAYRGVRGTSPLDASAATADTLTCPTASSTRPQALVVRVTGQYSSSTGPVTWAWDAPEVERVDHSSSTGEAGNYSSFTIADRILAVVGAADTTTPTPTGRTDGGDTGAHTCIFHNNDVGRVLVSAVI